METFSALLVVCAGTGHRWIPRTGANDAELYVFFDLRLNKRLSKNREVGDLRRHHAHYDVTVMYLLWITWYNWKGTNGCGPSNGHQGTCHILTTYIEPLQIPLILAPAVSLE